MQSGSSLSRSAVLLIAVISPMLLGSYFKCVAVSNPTVTTARIEQIEPAVLRVGEVMRASGGGEGAPPLQFAWDFGDGVQAAGSQTAHAYAAPGSYRITLIVRDAVGATASDASEVTVTARITSSAVSLILLSDAVAGQPVLFAALPYAPAERASTYAWTFSDGQSGAGAETAAIFPASGLYFASVVATDDLGAIALAQTAFHVMSAPH